MPSQLVLKAYGLQKLRRAWLHLYASPEYSDTNNTGIACAIIAQLLKRVKESM